MKTPNLMLHCGASAVSREKVARVKTPEATDTWTPVPHYQLIRTVEKSLKASGITIGTQAHSLTADGARYFGLLQIEDQTSRDYCWTVGLRNSHDKTFPAGIIAGASVFVCDNLSFSGEVKLARRHTRNILHDLPFLAQQAVGRLMDCYHQQDQRIAAYKQAEISDPLAHDIVVRATDVGACTNRMIPEILREWREPRYTQFQPRNIWSLFNAVTEALKDNLPELPKRTERLHGLMDAQVGLVQLN